MRHLILSAWSFLCLAPLVWMLFASVKTFSGVLSPRLIPDVWEFGNYLEVVDRAGFLVALRNSITVAIPATLAVILTSAAGGFVFAKYNFPGKRVLFAALLATLMVPLTVAIIPLFLTMRDFGLIDKLEGLILTGLCSTFGIFLLRQSISTIPGDYLDAARVDGASEAWIFLKVILPMSGPALATLAVLSFLGTWDSYMWPSVLLRSRPTETLPLILATLGTRFMRHYQLWAAAAMLTVIPTMILFTLAQKQFIRGLSMTGLKG